MTDKKYKSTPAELIISGFCGGHGDSQSLDIGLAALVESVSFERGSLYLISSRALVELSNQYSKTAKTSQFEPRASSLECGMAIILSCTGRGLIEILYNDTEAREDWQDYFELTGNSFPVHALIFLISPAGSNFGFLALEGGEEASLTEAKKEMIIHTAHAMTMVIDYSKLASAFSSKVDQSAASANRLIALREKLAKLGAESDSDKYLISSHKVIVEARDCPDCESN